MANSNGRITAPIGLDSDIPVVLGVSSKDLGTLCKSSTINKWARWKPVRYAKWAPITLSELQSTNFGLVSREVSAITNPPASSIPTTAAWTWLAPNEYYRITDFLSDTNPTIISGYNHQAKAPASGFRDITIFDDELNTLPTYTFNCKFGKSSWEGTGDTSGIEIALNELVILSGQPITNGSWRFGLAVYIPNGSSFVAQYASHEAAIGTISSTADINKMIINLRLSDTLRSALSSCFSSGVTQVTAIPFIGYNLFYNNSNPTNRFFYFASSGRAYCMPNGEKININLQKLSNIYNVSAEGGSLSYLNGTAGTYSLLPSVVHNWTKPVNSYSCRMILIFRLTYSTNIKRINVKSVKVGLSNTYINQIAESIKINRNGSFVDVSSISEEGIYQVTATDSYSGGARTPLSNMLNNLPVYNGSSWTQISLGINVSFVIDGKEYTKSAGSVNVRMSNA